MKLSKEKVFPIIMNALTEDVGTGDITSLSLFEKDIDIRAEITVKEECVLAGVDVARWIFNAIDERIIFRPLYKDGDKIRKGKRVVSLKGPLRNILTGERTVLNFMSTLSGVATLTHRFAGKVKSREVKIFDTRKTTPGLRVLEKYAVAIGGGCNHRMGLWDGILIKDNHIDSLKFRTHGSRLSAIKDAVGMAKKRGYKNIEIEVCNLKEFAEALSAGADIIMLDNMKTEDIRKAVKLKRSAHKKHGLKPVLEVSGGVNLKNISGIANIGVDRISIGALTHSAPSIDFSLEVCP